jgi:hypothetical protein
MLGARSALLELAALRGTRVAFDGLVAEFAGAIFARLKDTVEAMLNLLFCTPVGVRGVFSQRRIRISQKLLTLILSVYVPIFYLRTIEVCHDVSALISSTLRCILNIVR